MSDFTIVCPDTKAITRHEWLELRRQYVCGSDADAALNLSPYSNPVKLYAEKVDPLPEDDEREETERMYWGNVQEETIAQELGRRVGVNIIYDPVMVASTRWSWLAGNPDRFIPNGIVECKNVDVSQASEWRDGPPLHARIQFMTYLAVLGPDYTHGYIAALIGGNRFVHYYLERDEMLIESIVAGTEKFWTMVQMGRMPDIDGSDITAKAIANRYSDVKVEAVECGPALLDLVTERDAREKIVKMENDKLKEVDNKIKAMLGDAEAGMVDGVVIATWKSQTRKAHEVKESTFRKLHFPKQKEEKQ